MTSMTEALRGAVRGHVLLPGDDAFDDARKPFNRAVEQPVDAVVEAADADDVAALVRHAAATGGVVSAQAGGHGASGNLAGTVLLRTSRLDQLSVDPQARLARVGAGVSWGRVQEAVAPYGLTGLPGSSPVVSVTGYLLGGGLSWFGRAFGWAADSVVAFDVVLADGTPMRVTADTDAELFWALRGGGGDFAIVTAVEFRLHPAPDLYGGRMLWPGREAARVLDAFQAVIGAAPAATTVWFDLLHPPGADPLVAVDVTHLGSAAEAEALLRPFESIGGRIGDTRRRMPVSELGTITAEPPDPRASISSSLLLSGLDAAALLDEPLDPLLGVQVRHLGGALGGNSGTPFGPLTAAYYLFAVGLPELRAPAAISDRLDRLAADLGPLVSSRKPITSLAPGESIEGAFSPAVLARLRAVKERVDPAGTIRGNYPVPRAATAR